MRPAATYRANRVNGQRFPLLHKWTGDTYVKDRTFSGPLSLNRSKNWEDDTFCSISYTQVRRYASPYGDIPVDQHKLPKESAEQTVTRILSKGKKKRKPAPKMKEKNLLFGGSTHRGKAERNTLKPDEYGFKRLRNRPGADEIARSLREKIDPSGLMSVANSLDVRADGPNVGNGQRTGRVKQARVRCSPYRWAKSIKQGNSAKASGSS